MQLSLPWSDPAAAEIHFVRHRRARRYILRVLADGTVRVTLPRWGAQRDARAFVDASRAWIARERQRRAAAGPRDPAWRHGTDVRIDGQPVPIRLERRAADVRIWCGECLVATRSAVSDARPVVEAWLRERARRELPPQLRALAAAHGLAVTRISIRNQRSRWGACSPTGTITLNWRLVQTPPFVREYVLLHELMHRRELNHSRRFWRLVAASCPRHAEARQWLRQEGQSLWRES